jgi:hypothetical protein
MLKSALLCTFMVAVSASGAVYDVTCVNSEFLDRTPGLQVCAKDASNAYAWRTLY